MREVHVHSTVQHILYLCVQDLVHSTAHVVPHFTHPAFKISLYNSIDHTSGGPPGKQK